MNSCSACHSRSASKSATPRRSVIGAQLLAHPSVARPGHVTGGKMQQAGVVATCGQIRECCTAASTFVASASRKSGLKSVSPELLMTRSSRLCKRWQTSGARPSPGWRNVALDHLHPLTQKARQSSLRSARKEDRRPETPPPPFRIAAAPDLISAAGSADKSARSPANPSAC